MRPNKRTPGRSIAVMTLLMVLASVSAAAVAGEPGRGGREASGPDLLPGRYLVVVRDGADPQKVARDHGVQAEHVYRTALKGFGGPMSAGRAEALKRDPRVQSVEPDRVVQVAAQTLPTGVDRIDAEVNPTADIDGVDLPRVGVTVAVIDTGINLSHPDLNVRTNLAFNCAKGKNTAEDANGHGTHVAGTIGALDNGTGVVGVAPGASVVPVRVLGSNGSGTLTCVVKGIDWVTQNAGTISVANMSLSWTGNSPAARTAIQKSVGAGVVYTVAASNESRDVYGPDGLLGTNDDTQPAAFPEVATISAAADSDGDPGGLGPATGYGTDDSFASFSNYSRSVVAGNPVSSAGAAIDLMLPGVDIYSTYKSGAYTTMSGTSMASPHAAGLAALHIADHGRATSGAGVTAIRQALIDEGQNQATGRRLTHPVTEPDARPENLGWAGSPSTGEPIANDDAASTQHNTSVTVNVLANDMDSNGDDLDIASFDALGTAGGSVSCDLETGECTYTPPTGFTGTDRFTYVATDGTFTTDPATVTITVKGGAFIETFEGDVTGWSASGMWHRATSSQCTSPDAGYASPTRAFYYGQDASCSYANGSATTGTLTSPSIAVVGGSPIMVSFDSWRHVELYTGGSYDKTSVQVSFNGGSTWSTLWSRDSTTASQTDWTTVNVNVTPSSSNMRIRFVFDSVDAFDNDQVGWLIDDVTLG
ncbi:MAG TPA: S8 family serine peptidase [Actinomycetota bacterium]|nr:S8 family serine peptidase [Actinomycetota bacterium]